MSIRDETNAMIRKGPYFDETTKAYASLDENRADRVSRWDGSGPMPDLICVSCHANLTKGERHKVTHKAPSIRTMERMSNEGRAYATDGCIVEPDGRCEHGHRSWMLVLGYI